MESLALQAWAQNKALAEHHPVFLAASGSPVFGSLPGISMHVEMELLVRMGLTAREALAAATSNYADVFGWRELGSVAPGRRADLVVLDRDPAADIENSVRINLVMLGGGIIDRNSMLPPAVGSAPPQ
jgi:imidazolonepropionase-like amidohydrolase